MPSKNQLKKPSGYKFRWLEFRNEKLEAMCQALKKQNKELRKENNKLKKILTKQKIISEVRKFLLSKFKDKKLNDYEKEYKKGVGILLDWRKKYPGQSYNSLSEEINFYNLKARERDKEKEK